MIGETIYICDDNRRVYRDDDGTKRSTPNPREYFYPAIVTGEAFLDTAEVEDWIWAKEHRYAIVRLAEHADATILRKIAALLGYEG